MGAANLYVIVPVLNEAANMERLSGALRDIRNDLAPTHTVRVILVDDGSTDGTAGAARRCAADLGFAEVLDVLVHEVNRGPGAAFGTAFQSLAGRLQAADWVLTIEGDNTSRLELLGQMMTRAREGFDVVLASPYLYGGAIVNTSGFRMFLSHIANGIVKGALGIRGIATMSSFFRLHRGAVVLRLQACCGDRIIDRAGFECMIEMLLKLTYLRASISEVAMTLDTSQRIGKSKMSVIRTAVGYLTLWKDKGRWLQMAQTRGRGA
jgi:dolichol-phosphate mannosyltransferase